MASKNEKTSPSPGRSLAGLYGDGALALGSLCLVIIGAVLLLGAGREVTIRQRALKESERMTQLQADAKNASASLADKAQAVEAMTRQLAEKDQLLAANNTTIEDLKQQLAAAQAKRGGKSTKGGKKRR